MAKNVINFTEENETKMNFLKAVLVKKGVEIKNNSDLVNECISMLEQAMRHSDKKIHKALFGIEKQF